MNMASAVVETLRVGLVQVNPQEDILANIGAAQTWVRSAARDGARLVMLPEYASLLHASGREMRRLSPREDEHPALTGFRLLARELNVWLLIGSLTVRIGDDLVNRSYLLDAAGEVHAHYDKLHMFDATLPGGREIRESATYRAGDEAVVAQTPWGVLGMSICYDLRFPHLYRKLAQAGAAVLAVPSAFTRATGQRHWETLLRARAIENGAFVLAPATCGTHPGGHQTFGHAMAISPDGEVLARAGDEPGALVVDLDLTVVTRARQAIPSLRHDRSFSLSLTGNPKSPEITQ